MRAYFPFTFIVGNQKYCCIWYSDIVNGFVVESDKVKHFKGMDGLISYVVSHNLKIAEETTIFFVDGISHWLESQEASAMDCEEFLMFWNIVTDLAHSSGSSFYGDNNNLVLNVIYDKLYKGSQIAGEAEDSSLSSPVWDHSELIELAKVIVAGLAIIESSLLGD